MFAVLSSAGVTVLHRSAPGNLLEFFSLAALIWKWWRRHSRLLPPPPIATVRLAPHWHCFLPLALCPVIALFVTPQSFLHLKRRGFAFPDMSPVYRKSERRLRLVCLCSFPRLRKKKEKEFAMLFLPRRCPESQVISAFIWLTLVLCRLLTDFSAVLVAFAASVLPFETCWPACSVILHLIKFTLPAAMGDLFGFEKLSFPPSGEAHVRGSVWLTAEPHAFHLALSLSSLQRAHMVFLPSLLLCCPVWSLSFFLFSLPPKTC